MTMTSLPTPSPVRRVAINALALVGFVVLIIIGMTLAIYAASFVPTAVTRLNSAAVYLSSVFVPADKAGLDVVAPGTEIPFGEAPGAGIATTTVATTTPTKTTPVAQTPGEEKTTAYIVGTAPTTGTLSGFSDLGVTVNAVGYLSSGNNEDSFVASNTIPDGLWAAVKFTVKNTGTNISGTYDFKAVVPTSSAYTLYSGNQDSLSPGEAVQYTIRFERARVGTDREVVITVDPDSKIHEVSEINNEVTAKITVE